MTRARRRVSVGIVKRDMELIRLLLLQQEAGEPFPELETYDSLLVAHHCALIIEAGFVVGEVVSDADQGGIPVGAAILRLTWKGHEFLDSIRDPSVWQQAKDYVLRPGASWTFGILTEFLKAEASKRLGEVLN